MNTQDRLANALRNLCAEMASVAKERGVSRDQVNTYRWCKRRIMAIVADHLTKTHPQPAQDAEDAARLEWYFGPSDKKDWLDTYMRGMREGWSVGQWRAAIDAAMAKESGQ